MSNFKFLLSEPGFVPFAEVAMAAEKILHIDPAASVLNCRRAMEYAVKWMYSVDEELEMPYQDNLKTLMDSGEFRDIVGKDLWERMKLIRTKGNHAAHNSNQKITEEMAMVCLENLHIFLDFVAYCYGYSYVATKFDPQIVHNVGEASRLPGGTGDPSPTEGGMGDPSPTEIDLVALIEENKKLKEQLTARRAEQLPTYVPKPLDISEYETRKFYIDTMLVDAGWVEGRDWLNEVALPGMDNKSEMGYADYVLYDDAQVPLAIIEAKRTCADVSQGRQQAVMYAEILEKKYRRKPVIFLTNGFETHIIDGQYPERKCACVYSKRDLEKLFNLRAMRTSLKNIMVKKDIAGRYYQEGAIKAVCDAFDRKNRRKALLVMATGSGKTRTVIALCDVLLQRGWVKNVLFLADRNSLVTQAMRSFKNLLPDLSVTDLCEEKDNYNAHCVFSTYQTMMHCIDNVKDDQGKLYTCGHFDLVICDEAHRSIYNKYRDIFNYFDAPLVGLTATPKDEIDKNTYEVFDLQDGVPTYGYELAQAVRDGYLVDFISVETKLKFMEQGITYDELSEADRETYEATFEDENGELPEKILSSALNEWVFNIDTIRQVLHVLMTEGLRIDYGQTLGKTIIFAKNHAHAEKIREVFDAEYPHLPDFAQVIDNKVKHAQKLIDRFSDPKKLPQIAISVDMMDTGIDVPECLNLVFFKKVMSKAKFWQMIGRGTRLCEGLLDGENKSKFYIFDFCGNFEFFRMGGKQESANQIPLQGAVFGLKAELAWKLQDLAYQTPELTAFREELVADMVSKVQELNRDNFAVRQHLKYVELYSNPDHYAALTYENTLQMRAELAPLILPDEDDPKAVRFDALMYGIELASLAGGKYPRARKDLLKRVSTLASLGTIPQIAAQRELIQKILQTDYLERAGIREFEHIRQKLRDLIAIIPPSKIVYTTNLRDEILTMERNEADLENDDLKSYKMSAEYYIRNHREEPAIAKLRTNRPLSAEDVKALETILWSEVGSEEDYRKEFGNKPLGEFVREIVGLDMNAAKEAFGEYLNDTSLDSRQIYFVNQIVEYVVRNGMMKDLSVLQDSPFTDNGSVVEIFTDLSVWLGIRRVIDRINANAAA